MPAIKSEFFDVIVSAPPRGAPGATSYSFDIYIRNASSAEVTINFIQVTTGSIRDPRITETVNAKLHLVADALILKPGIAQLTEATASLAMSAYDSDPNRFSITLIDACGSEYPVYRRQGDLSYGAPTRFQIGYR